MAIARERMPWFKANQCSLGTSCACDMATRQLVLQGLATTSTRALGDARLMARACSIMIGAF